MGLVLAMLLSVWTTESPAEPLSSGGGLSAMPGAVGADAAGRSPLQGEVRGPNTPPTSIIDRSAIATEVPTASKTIELLIEMQGKNPGLEAGERPKAEMPEGVRQPRSAVAAAASQPFRSVDPANPFGGGELTPNRARDGADPQAVDWSEGPTSRFGGGGLGGAGGSGSTSTPYRPPPTSAAGTDEGDLRWRLPRAVVRFLRENRDAVIGGVLVVALLWIAATAIAGSRRK